MRERGDVNASGASSCSAGGPWLLIAAPHRRFSNQHQRLIDPNQPARIFNHIRHGCRAEEAAW